MIYEIFYFMIIKFPGGYPKNIDVGLQVVAYLADSDGKIFCTAVLISINKGICIKDCLSDKDLLQNNYYAYVGQLSEQTSRLSFRIFLIDSNDFQLFKVCTSTGNQWNHLNPISYCLMKASE